MIMNAIYIGVALFVLLLTLNFWSTVTDYIYMAFRYWKHTLFIVICIGGGLYMGLYATHLDKLNNLFVYDFGVIRTPSHEDVQVTIRRCREFTVAKRDGDESYIDPKPPFIDVIKIGAKTYWDTCARVLGSNYWKHDISIDGENGGKVFCAAYRAGDYRSSTVNVWCDTVLDPYPEEGK